MSTLNERERRSCTRAAEGSRVAHDVVFLGPTPVREAQEMRDY